MRLGASQAGIGGKLVGKAAPIKRFQRSLIKDIIIARGMPKVGLIS